MKKYMLKKWYPSLYEDIEEGIEVEYKDGWIYYVNTRGNKTCVEFDEYEFNFTDYWEEGKPKPLFITDDNIKIFDDATEIIIVSTKYYTVSKIRYKYLSKPLNRENFKYFEFDINANKYIEDNKPKPLFITDDGVEVFDDDPYIILKRNYEKVETVAHKNGDYREGVIRFKHESNADEYIWKNKPVFSYEDFRRWGNVPYDRVIMKLAKERTSKK